MVDGGICIDHLLCLFKIRYVAFCIEFLQN